MFIEVFSCCDRIIEGGFGLAKTQVHQAISRIIDEHQQATFIATSFKLIMMRAIVLDELTKAVTAITRLINTRLTL
ncbi:ABC transporter ATP-binding protein [Vibrio nereis]|uniref:ABC transporter ATP-binding protein n=1 Tax=Vibrio nereis TaxID=693 RepID=A0A0M0HQF9_VIBNE|nr:ABC transporter ATP-binding protein [Vibrio nereis]KOO12050.1 ABC transporter ATP-binding protein [Vibrio xuii]